MEIAMNEIAQSRVERAGQALADSIMPHHVHIISTKNGLQLEIQVDGRSLVSMESDNPIETADALYSWTHKLLTGRK
jgi:hypothetical protein